MAAHLAQPENSKEARVAEAEWPKVENGIGEEVELGMGAIKEGLTGCGEDFRFHHENTLNLRNYLGYSMDSR